MLCLGLGTAALTWGHIMFGISTDELEGKLYWFSTMLLCLWSVVLAVQEIAVTVLWMKLRRARALWHLERLDLEGSPTPEESISEDPHLNF